MAEAQLIWLFTVGQMCLRDWKPLKVKINYLVFLGKRSTERRDGNKYFESNAELRGMSVSPIESC